MLLKVSKTFISLLLCLDGGCSCINIAYHSETCGPQTLVLPLLDGPDINILKSLGIVLGDLPFGLELREEGIFILSIELIKLSASSR